MVPTTSSVQERIEFLKDRIKDYEVYIKDKKGALLEITETLLRKYKTELSLLLKGEE